MVARGAPADAADDPGAASGLGWKPPSSTSTAAATPTLVHSHFSVTKHVLWSQPMNTKSTSYCIMSATVVHFVNQLLSQISVLSPNEAPSWDHSHCSVT